jgi:predicted outer membrane repeat protein
MTNVTFSGNRALDGGGALYVETGDSLLNNVTFVGNIADSDDTGDGDGGAYYQDGEGTTRMRNTIIALNKDLGGEAANCGGPGSGELLSQGYNLFGFLGGCNDIETKPSDVILNGPAGISPLRDNGGLTKTHALKQSSPAVDAGSKKKPGSTGGCAKRDQRKVKRPQGKRCDIGAFELK